MTKKNIQIKLEKGQEARRIALLVQEASKYESKIYIEEASKRVNAKSIMGMMSLSIDAGAEVTVTAEGVDEQEAVDAIEKFLKGSV
ncbi:MAG: HPr family phosphocarrier protein [Bacteroidales bacterium]|nr:HPr family phosphocarrier protein [Lachnoclostridium sp.]MCM1384571.1 HPr family phosphocarrier protein [Lachnoclostridium sp.]MCM1465147.1 HPr family phosphocarrier protein [Bacteroidales bacterium]